jgi:hypothetical protein
MMFSRFLFLDYRVNTTKFFLIIATLVLFYSGHAKAKVRVQDEKKYTIDNIKIYSKSDNATLAKELALKGGERKALKELFSRIGIDKSYTKYVNDGIVSDMIATIKISEEIITNNSYSGILTVVFDAEFIRYNLDNLGVKSGKVTNDVVLYIPIFDDDSGKLDILDSSNIWYQAAYNKFFEDNFDDLFLIDNYSLSNSGLLNKNQITNIANYMSFETLLMKYSSNVVLISLAKYNKNNDSVDIILREITAESVEEKVLNYLNRDGLPKDKLVEYASVQLFEFIKNSQKTRRDMNHINVKPREIEKNKFTQSNYIDVIVPTPNLREFVFTKNLIIHFSFVRNIEILELTRRLASVRLYFNCNENELVHMFGVKNFNLSYRSGQYSLSYQQSNPASPVEPD